MNRLSSFVRNFKSEKFILSIVLLELFLGGTGRLIEFNSFLTLRMVFFFIYLLISVYYLFRGEKLPILIYNILGLFLIINIISIFIGIVQGAEGSSIFEDIKPLLNIFLIPYLFFSIKNFGDIQLVIKLIKISSILLAILHLILFAIFINLQDSWALYTSLNPDNNSNNVFILKGDNGFIFYTGDLYLCIGFLFWDLYSKKGFLKILALSFLSIAIILTGTRGLILALAFVYLVKYILFNINLKSLIYLLFGSILIGAVFFVTQSNIGDKNESDLVRYLQVSQVWDKITPFSLVFGHGFGIGIPIRPIHMEISYLEIFHKQGLIGLFYYSYILYVIFKKFNFSNSNYKIGMLLSVLFVFFLSGTNPYINHPLGITIISISLVCLMKFEKMEWLTNYDL